MKKVILFGSTGNLGRKIAAELVAQQYEVTAVIRNETKKKEMADLVQHCLVADVQKRKSLSNICNSFQIVVSSLGKSVSPNDRSKASFREIDLEGNNAILQEALKSGVKKFVYISALHAEKYPHLEYFRVHHQFSVMLKASGLDYSIIKPPALFSAFTDLIHMAQRGQLVTFGQGDKLTNPIYEGDLARICVKSIEQPYTEIEVGGKEVLSRLQINQLIQQHVNPAKKVRQIPLGLVKACLPLLKFASRNMYDKLAFFTEVIQHDTIAPPFGEMKLAEYLEKKT